MVISLGLLVSACGWTRDSTPSSPVPITATPIPILQPIVATETPSPSPRPTSTPEGQLPPVSLPTPIAAVITQTPTFTPTATDTPATPDAAPNYAPVGGLVAAGGSTSGTGGGCATVPQGRLGQAYQNDPDIQAALGCPLAASATLAKGAYQPFENGQMVWVSAPQPSIYALYSNGTYQQFPDTFQEGIDPNEWGDTPPEGRIAPIRGFGKVWHNNPSVQAGLGWATAAETGDSLSPTAEVLQFERGEMLYISQAGRTYILLRASNTWR